MVVVGAGDGVYPAQLLLPVPVASTRNAPRVLHTGAAVVVVVVDVVVVVVDGIPVHSNAENVGVTLPLPSTAKS